MPALRWSVLFALHALTSELAAQASPFAALRGDWTGEGTLFNRPARFAMAWRDGNGFATLMFTNGTVDSLGTVTPVLRAAAVYRLDPARREGVWLDSRGVRIELAWEATDTSIVVVWTAPTESGRTTYRPLPSGDVEVTDEVRTGETWRVFGRAVHRRVSR